MKKILGLSTLALAGVLAFTGCSVSQKDGEAWAKENGYVKQETVTLTYPTKNATCEETNKHGPTCAVVNAENITQYLGRDDIDFIDARNAADYQAGHVVGFRNVEFFNFVYPQGAQKGQIGTQLFYKAEDGTFAPTYTTSVATLESLFPRDKVLFLMCQSGGRITQLMNLLEQYGYDMTKVYNVGGWGSNGAYGSVEELVVKTGNDYKYTIYTGEANATAGGTALNVTVKVAYDDVEGKVGGVYIVDDASTLSSTQYTDKVNGGRAALLKSFVGKTLAEVRATVGANNALSGIDVISGATITSRMIANAVINALSEIDA